MPGTLLCSVFLCGAKGFVLEVIFHLRVSLQMESKPRMGKLSLFQDPFTLACAGAFLLTCMFGLGQGNGVRKFEFEECEEVSSLNELVWKPGGRGASVLAWPLSHLLTYGGHFCVFRVSGDMWHVDALI